MLRKIAVACFIAVSFGSVSLNAIAQEVVHALTGTVSSIDAASKTVTLLHDGGGTIIFKDLTTAKAPASLDKKIHADTTAADAFKKSGAYVIVFYCGQEDARSVIGLKSLGDGPFTSATGTVTKFEGHDRSITLTDESGAAQTFKITDDTVGEGGFGVVNGLKFQVQKGDRVRIVGSTAGGGQTALFIRQM